MDPFRSSFENAGSQVIEGEAKEHRREMVTLPDPSLIIKKTMKPTIDGNGEASRLENYMNPF